MTAPMFQPSDLSSLRVLIWVYATGRIPGGHQIQARQTCRHLLDAGIDAVLSFEDEPNLAGIDIVHGFSLDTPQIRACRERGIPVALSTIYWGRDYVMGVETTGSRLGMWRRRLRAGSSLGASALFGQHVDKCDRLVWRLNQQRIIFEMCDMLLPNSTGEATAVRAELNITTPLFVVPNAVDELRFTPSEEPSKSQGILYVGRFEPHKNQLGLIRAMRGSKIRVTLVGPPHPDHEKYFQECIREAGGNIAVKPQVDHDSLPDLYRSAKVHVLPSWFETTGLVSLEAALCGCNIVTTKRGHAAEYFGDCAWYCDPSNSESIRTAVEKAHAAPHRTELAEKIVSRFTWRHTASATIAAYRTLLAKRMRSASDVASGVGS